MLDELYETAYQEQLQWLDEQEATRRKKSNYTQNGYWSPIYWPVIEAENLTVFDVVVLGRVLGYCQGKMGACTASMQTIANACHISLSSVKRSMQILESRGYIEDRTPNILKAPHTYEDTGKTGRILERAKKEARERQSWVTENQD
jgi:hypothetical protein